MMTDSRPKANSEAQLEAQLEAQANDSAGTRSSLIDWPKNQPATVVAIDWEALGASQSRRLREMGADIGIKIEILHYGPIDRDPIACKIGRMTLAIGRKIAPYIWVEKLTSENL